MPLLKSTEWISWYHNYINKGFFFSLKGAKMRMIKKLTKGASMGISKNILEKKGKYK